LLYCPRIPPASSPVIAEVVRGPIVLLLTSQWAEPGRPPGLSLPGADPGRLRFVLLGCQHDAERAAAHGINAAPTRWHTPEISSTALAALRNGSDHVLGQLRPWDEQPV
jgi:hypothetical protein